MEYTKVLSRFFVSHRLGFRPLPNVCQFHLQGTVSLYHFSGFTKIANQKTENNLSKWKSYQDSWHFPSLPTVYASFFTFFTLPNVPKIKRSTHFLRDRAWRPTREISLEKVEDVLAKDVEVKGSNLEDFIKFTDTWIYFFLPGSRKWMDQWWLQGGGNSNIFFYP